MKKKWYRKFQFQRDQVWQFVFCIVGVGFHKIIDIGGETVTLENLSLGYAGFALFVAILYTVWTDDEPIPPKQPDEKEWEYHSRRKKIIRRIIKHAFLAGFFCQVMISRVEGLIEV